MATTSYLDIGAVRRPAHATGRSRSGADIGAGQREVVYDTLAEAMPYAVAFYPFESNGNDFVGTNNLSSASSPSFAAGKFGNAADFESGSNNSLSCSDNTVFSATNTEFGIRLWLKLESLTTCAIIQKGEAGTLEYALVITSSGELRWNVYDSSINEYRATWGSNLSTGTWYLVHVRYSAAGRSIGITVNAGTEVIVPMTATVNDSTGAIFFGNRQSGDTPYDGLIDDVVFLKNYLLNKDQRLLDYNGGTGVAFADWDGGPDTYTASADLNVGAATASLTGTFLAPPGGVPVKMNHYRRMRAG